jgi:orotidine-5'-phosphate decarboxylase
MTLNPYLGDDSMAPFAEASHRYGKGVFICVLTSNPGSNLFQALISDGRPIYQWVADMVSGLASQQIGNRGYSSVGAVVGATHPEQASMLRKQLPSSLFLVPGFGAQQGSLDAIKNCFNRDGLGAVISSSRSIMYPHLFGPAGHAEMAVREATQHFIAEVASCLRIL